MGQATGRLTGKVNPGFLAETKIPECTVKIFRPHLFDNLDGPDVARKFNDLLQGQPTVFMDVVHHVFADSIGAVFTEKYFVRRNLAIFQRRRRTEHFYG